MLGFYDPITGTSTYPPAMDDLFLGFYTFEMLLKIIGLGLILKHNAYLRDPWNIMDFVVVITAYIPILIGGNEVNLRGLRSLRVLRPLRTISSVKSLRVIVSTVLQTLPYIRDIMLIALFMLFIYAIVGLELFMGSTKNRCIDLNTGIPVHNPIHPEIDYQRYCGSWECTPDLGLENMNLACAKMIDEPNYGITNFDTILWSLLNVYQIITQEGWSVTMVIIQATWSSFSCLYFISCTVIGSWYFMNLIMAVITTIFEMNSKDTIERLDKDNEPLDQEEKILKHANMHKAVIVNLIHQYHKGEIKYDKIQSIEGKLYFYDEKKMKKKKKKKKKQRMKNKEVINEDIENENEKMLDKNKEKELNNEKDKGLDEEKDKDKRLDKEKDKGLDKENGKGLDKEKDKGSDKEKDKDKRLDKEKDKGLDKENGKGLDKEKDKGSDKEKDKGLDKDKDKGLDKEKWKDKDKDKEKQKSIDKEKVKGTDKEKEMVKMKGKNSDNNERGSNVFIRCYKAMWRGLIEKVFGSNHIRHQQHQQQKHDIITIEGTINDRLMIDTTTKGMYTGCQSVPTSTVKSNKMIVFHVEHDEEDKSPEAECVKVELPEVKISIPEDEAKSETGAGIGLGLGTRIGKRIGTGIGTGREMTTGAGIGMGIGGLEEEEEKGRLGKGSKAEEKYMGSMSNIESIEQDDDEDDDNKTNSLGGFTLAIARLTGTGDNSGVTVSVNGNKTDKINKGCAYEHLAGASGDLNDASGEKDSPHKDNSYANGDKAGGCIKKIGTYGDKASAYGDKAGTYGDKTGTCGDKTGTYGDKAGVYGDKAGTGRYNAYIGGVNVFTGGNNTFLNVDKTGTRRRRRRSGGERITLINLGHRGAKQASICSTQEPRFTLENNMKDHLHLHPHYYGIRSKKDEEKDKLWPNTINNIDQDDNEISRKYNSLKVRRNFGFGSMMVPRSSMYGSKRRDSVLSYGQGQGRVQSQIFHKLRLQKKDSITQRMYNVAASRENSLEHIEENKGWLRENKGGGWLRGTCIMDRNEESRGWLRDDKYNNTTKYYQQYLKERRKRGSITKVLTKKGERKHDWGSNYQYYYLDEIEQKQVKNELGGDVSGVNANGIGGINGNGIGGISGIGASGDNRLYMEDYSEIREYIEDDENVEYNGINKKDRLIVDIKDLKIDVNYDKVMTKNSSLEEVIPSYYDRDRLLRERKAEKSRSKIKLGPVYRIWEDEKKNSRTRNNKLKAKYKLLVRYGPPKNKLYNKDLISTLKNDLNLVNKQKKWRLLFRNERRLSSRSFSRLLTSKTIRRPLGQGEANIDMNYGLTKMKIDDDNQIDANDILDNQVLEFFNLDKEYAELKQEDLIYRSIKSRNWCAHEILSLPGSYVMHKINSIKDALMKQYESIWEPGYYGLFQAFRRRIKRFCYSQIFLNLMLATVILNTICLASIGILPEDPYTMATLSMLNQLFSILFITELGLKLIGDGPLEYLKDPMNILDSIVVLISVVEILFEADAHAFKALKAIRILRASRVLRVTKLLRGLAFMRFLIHILAKSLKDFISVLFLIIIFSYIYALLGMQLLGGLFHYPDNIGWNSIRSNFDTLPQALISVFQVMTVEKWNQILYFAERSTAGYYLPLLYLISWIIIGNYILLNLLMAMLLAQFGGNEMDEDQQELVELENIDERDIEGDDIQTKETVQDPELHFTLTNPKFLDILNKDKMPNMHYTKSSTANLMKLSSLSITNMLEDKHDSEHTSHDNIFELYDDNYCDRSLFIFRKDWIIRKTLYRLTKYKWFDNVILIMIILSSIKLALDTYVNNMDVEYLKTLLQYIDIGITVFFIVEAIIKIMVSGLILHPGGYLRDPWNVLDFLIVLVGAFDMIMHNVNLPFLKVFRLFRILRPLRLVSHNQNMRLIVTALLKSILGILNVGILYLLILLIFAILGVNLLRNKLGICDVSKNPNLSRYNINYETCSWMGYQWMTWNINWDNVFNGLVSLFVLSTQEDWPDYMFKCIDSNDIDIGPIKNNNLLIFLYFAIFLLIGSFFLTNLFVGVIMYQYIQAEKYEKNKYIILSDEQQKWIQIQKMILGVKPLIVINPNNEYQKFWSNIVNTNAFEVVILASIILNMIVLSFQYDESTILYNNILNFICYMFNAVFIFEIFAKISAEGYMVYFKNNWNRFDILIILLSLLYITFSNFGFTKLDQMFKIMPQLLRILKVFRATRLVHYNKHFLNTQKIIYTIMRSLPSTANIFALVLLVFYIYAILATFLFSNIASGEHIGVSYNFTTFINSIITLFVCSTGEKWYVIMFDTIHPQECYHYDHNDDAKANNTSNIATNCDINPIICWIFWITFIIIVRYIVLNLFIMVMLDLFSNMMIDEYNPLKAFTDNIYHFKDVWKKFTLKNRGLFIHQKQLVPFFLELQQPLGFKKDNQTQINKYDVQEAAKNVMKMQIKTRHDKMISFHEVLFKANQRLFGLQDKLLKGNDFIEKFEEKTLKKIYLLNRSLTMKSKIPSSSVKQDPKSIINPLFRHLFMTMSFRAWLNYLNKMNKPNPYESSSCIDEYTDDDDEDDDDDEGDDPGNPIDDNDGDGVDPDPNIIINIDNGDYNSNNNNVYKYFYDSEMKENGNKDRIIGDDTDGSKFMDGAKPKDDTQDGFRLAMILNASGDIEDNVGKQISQGNESGNITDPDEKIIRFDNNDTHNDDINANQILEKEEEEEESKRIDILEGDGIVGQRDLSPSLHSVMSPMMLMLNKSLSKIEEKNNTNNNDTDSELYFNNDDNEHSGVMLILPIGQRKTKNTLDSKIMQLDESTSYVTNQQKGRLSFNR